MQRRLEGEATLQHEHDPLREGQPSTYTLREHCTEGQQGRTDKPGKASRTIGVIKAVLFGKRSFCLSDIRHCRHLRRFPGSEEQSLLFWWVKCNVRILLPIFVKTTCFLSAVDKSTVFQNDRFDNPETTPFLSHVLFRDSEMTIKIEFVLGEVWAVGAEGAIVPKVAMRIRCWKVQILLSRILLSLRRLVVAHVPACSILILKEPKRTITGPDQISGLPASFWILSAVSSRYTRVTPPCTMILVLCACKPSCPHTWRTD